MNKLPFENISREVLTKKHCTAGKECGCDPYERPVEELLKYGVVNINKPAGPTSHIVADFVKQMVGISKAGHSGTLDPGVTGVLPVALGRATRITQVLLPAGKEYVALMHLHKPVDKVSLKRVLNKFVGGVEQLPPVRSAVKRRARQRKIYYIDVLEVEAQDVLFRVGCQAGTYIRKLCHDIGQSLGIGAHMAQLVRTKAGPFTDEHMVYLQDLKDGLHYWKNNNDDSLLRKIVYPVEFAIGHIPKVWVNDLAVDSVCRGADLKIPGVCRLNTGIQKDDLVAIMTLKGEFIGLGKAAVSGEEIILQEKGIAIKSHKVFMEPGVYRKFRRETQGKP